MAIRAVELDVDIGLGAPWNYVDSMLVDTPNTLNVDDHTVTVVNIIL